jgi:hypothetical protein
MAEDKYDSYVEHPRYGRRPRYTGLNPQTDFGGGTFLHWHSSGSCRIPNTAIPADPLRQSPATVSVTHYFDVERECRDCRRMFIFFAAEQQHWYEELQFGLDSDCVRCPPCRKKRQESTELREQYESLLHQPNRDERQTLTMAECCLKLIESGDFTTNQCQRVRALINCVHRRAFTNRVEAIRQRLGVLESQG